MKKIKLLKDWNGHAAGTVLEVDETTYAEIKALDACANYDPTIKAADVKVREDIATMAKEAVDEALADVELAKKTVDIEVHDRSDDDPVAGYLGEHSKNAEELTEAEIAFAAGQQLKDIYKAQNQPAREGTRLHKSQQVAEAQAKAAGDGMVVGDDEFGGFALMPAAVQMMQRTMIESAVVRPRATTMTIGSQMLTIPTVRDEDRTNNRVYQGIVSYWEDELDQSTSSRPKMRQVNLKLKKLTSLGYVSEKWLKWSAVSLGTWLIPKFGESAAYVEDVAFMVGNGAGQPLGILNSPSVISIAKESGQAADTLVRENVDNMLARRRILPGSNWAWVVNQTVFPQLPTLKVDLGTGGSAIFVNNIAGAPGQSLWGIPVIYTENVPALGDAQDVNLIDFNDYIIADDQSGPALAQSIHLKFDYGQTAFRLTRFVDGQNFSDKPYTPPTRGTTAPDTLSCALSLAERA